MVVLTDIQNIITESNVALAKQRRLLGSIMGNERADDLARRGAEQPLMGPKRIVTISYAQFKEYFRLCEEIHNKKARPEEKGPYQRRTIH